MLFFEPDAIIEVGGLRGTWDLYSRPPSRLRKSCGASVGLTPEQIS
jgi:hypothetical protein